VPILIVEDDSLIRELAVVAVEDWGYRVLEAGTVAEALLFLRSSQPIALLFTDINLHGVPLGGCDLAREAIGLRPKLNVVYTTGNFISTEMSARFVADSRVLRKPYSLGQLKDCFSTLLAA